MKLYCSRVSHNPYKEDMVTEIPENVFTIDGYSFGGTLLEGVLFDIHFNNDTITNVEISDLESKKWFENNLNSEKWYESAKKYGKRVLEGDEVDVPLFIKKKYFINGINVSYIAP